LNITIPEIQSTLQTLWGETANQLARRCGLVQRQSGLSAQLYLAIVVVGFTVWPESSYNQLAQIALDFGLKITGSGLEARTNVAALHFMRGMFEESLRVLRPKMGLELSLLNQFEGVYLLDSSRITLPSSLAQIYGVSTKPTGKAALKLQTLWEVRGGQVEQVEVEAACNSDWRYRGYFEHLPAGSLILFDLGYSVLKSLAQLKHQQVYFVCRFNFRCQVFQTRAGTEVDLLSQLRQGGAPLVQLELLVGKEDKVACRLVALRLPREVVEERRRKAKLEAKSKGRQAPSQSLEWLEWGLYLTNVEEERLQAQQVALMYCVRWQIELLFKLWKGQARLDRIAGRTPYRIGVEIYAKLIGLVIFHYLSGGVRWSENKAGQVRQLSEVKAYQILRVEFKGLGQAIVKGQKRKVGQILKQLYYRWQEFGGRDQRRVRLSTFQLLELATTELAQFPGATT
jgi:hypothetical protein